MGRNAAVLLSIVMPVHNPGEYLKKCIDSIQRQTFRKFELLAINDNSTDGSLEILKEYSCSDERIKIYNNKITKGAAKSRNFGIDKAQGEYIIILDSDDFYENNFFEKMLDKVMLYNADVGLCAFYSWNTKKKINISNWVYPSNIDLLDGCGVFKPTDDSVKNNIFSLTSWAPYTKILKRSFIKKNNLQFQDISSSNDMYFGWMVCALAKNIVYISTPLVHYRIYSGNQITTNVKQGKGYNTLVAIKKIYDSLENKKILPLLRVGFYKNSVSSILSSFENDRMSKHSINKYLNRINFFSLNEEDLYQFDYRSKAQYFYIIMLASDGYCSKINTLIKCFARSGFNGLFWIVGHYCVTCFHIFRL